MKMKKAVNFHSDRELAEQSRVWSEALCPKILWEGLTMGQRTT